MDYETINNYVPTKGKKWIKWQKCLYLQRFRGTIRIKYGYRYRSTSTMGIWYPNGKFKLLAQHYYPSMRWRINQFMPEGYQIRSHRYYAFISKLGEEPKSFYTRTEHRPMSGGLAQANNPRWLVITKTGVRSRLGKTLKRIKYNMKKADNIRDLPRRRGRYWIRKARGMYRHRCGNHYPMRCEWRMLWPKPTTDWKGECGCHVYTKKARSRDTVATILSEQNATVRSAKIQIYDIEKFFNDAAAKTRDKEGGYQLLELDTGQAQMERDRWGNATTPRNLVLTALRMECSTTGTVYINTVPPEIRTVRNALDWMYNTSNYLERVGKQT